MIEIKGLNAEVKVYTELLEDLAAEQIKGMADHSITERTQVRIMPDVHAGKGSTIGTTIKLPENFEDWKVSPNVVGVDVGCGILMYKLGDKSVDLERLDNEVNARIPAGFNVHKNPQDRKFTDESLKNLSFKIRGEKKVRVSKSLGTLGGGNHFIELGVDENGAYWLSVHSGSRNLGIQVAHGHQNIAIAKLNEDKIDLRGEIDKLKAAGKHNEIQKVVTKLKAEFKPVTKEDEVLAWLEGENLKDYLQDMDVAQKYAAASRAKMLDIIVDAMGFEVVDQFDSVHNFIEHDNFKNGMIRKGATSAKVGERLVIPLNMRDGSIIAIGKGNEDWNVSAPHGAGRMMSRSQARRELDVEEFKAQMGEVYSTSVGDSTIDEAPGAYKPSNEILKQIAPTADVLHIVKPLYNFKSH